MSITKVLFATTVSTLSLCNPGGGSVDPVDPEDCGEVFEVTDGVEYEKVMIAIFQKEPSLDSVMIKYLWSDGEVYMMEGASCWLDEACESDSVNWWLGDNYSVALLKIDPQGNVTATEFQRQPTSDQWVQWANDPDYRTVVPGSDCF